MIESIYSIVVSLSSPFLLNPPKNLPEGLFLSILRLNQSLTSMAKKMTKKEMSLGERIRQLRRERDWSQEKLAKMVGLHLQSIGLYEKDESIPTALVLKKIADAFGVSVDYIISGGTDKAVQIKNKELLKRIEQLDRISPEDLSGLLQMMDLVIRSHQVKELATAS